MEKIEPGYFYHIYNRGNNKEDLFKEERNYFFFLDLLKKHLNLVADIYAYCLLKNHFHLLVRIRDLDFLPIKYTEDGIRAYQPFSNLFNSYAKSINNAYGRCGSLFQKPVQRIKVLTKDYVLQLVAYIHLNPIKHGFVDDINDYKYSSYKQYLRRDISFINTKIILKMFGGLRNFEYWHNVIKTNNNNKFNDLDKYDFYE